MIGRAIGQYEVVAELGRGGMGVVYLARQANLDRLVAIKVLPFADREMGERLRREAQALAELHHPHIVSIYDVGEVQGSPYYAMAYCAGGSLAEVIRQHGALSTGRAVNVLGAVADALGSIHEHGMAHRDVKPSNVLLSGDGQPYLSDFGLVGGRESSRLTTSGAVLGTVGYSAPELLDGRSPSPASDVYSWGVLGYEVLAGRPAYPGTHVSAVLDAVRRGDRTRLAEVAPAAPEGLVALIESALARDPADRPADMSAVARQVRAFAAPERLVPARPDDVLTATIASARRSKTPAPVSIPAAAPRSRRRLVIGVVAAVAVIAAGVGVFAAISGKDSPQPAAASPAAVNVTLPTKQTADGVRAESTWELTGDGNVRGVTTLTNTTQAELVTAHDEVIPKALITDAASVKSAPQFVSVVQADPIVRYCLRLGAGERGVVTWTAPVATPGLDETALDKLALQWSVDDDTQLANPGGVACETTQIVTPPSSLPDTTLATATTDVATTDTTTDTTVATSETTSGTAPPPAQPQTVTTRSTEPTAGGGPPTTISPVCTNCTDTTGTTTTSTTTTSTTTTTTPAVVIKPLVRYTSRDLSHCCPVGQLVTVELTGELIPGTYPIVTLVIDHVLFPAVTVNVSAFTYSFLRPDLKNNWGGGICYYVVDSHGDKSNVACTDFYFGP